MDSTLRVRHIKRQQQRLPDGCVSSCRFWDFECPEDCERASGCSRSSVLFNQPGNSMGWLLTIER